MRLFRRIVLLCALSVAICAGVLWLVARGDARVSVFDELGQSLNIALDIAAGRSPDVAFAPTDAGYVAELATVGEQGHHYVLATDITVIAGRVVIGNEEMLAVLAWYGGPPRVVGMYEVRMLPAPAVVTVVVLSSKGRARGGVEVGLKSSTGMAQVAESDEQGRCTFVVTEGTWRVLVGGVYRRDLMVPARQHVEVSVQR